MWPFEVFASPVARNHCQVQACTSVQPTDYFDSADKFQQFCTSHVQNWSKELPDSLIVFVVFQLVKLEVSSLEVLQCF